jgi:Pin2-interacting protein X1
VVVSFFLTKKNMGLAGPRQKQRIGDDPRNLKWKKDQEAVGFKMLSKMGWSEGKGLGAEESGMQDYIKVKVKDNNYGIGADARTSDNWLENAFAFDSLLQDLKNDTSIVVPETNPEPVVMGYRHSHRAKFVRNKVVSNYDNHQINNILGKTRDGQVQHAADEKEPSQIPEQNHIVDGVTTVTQNLGIQDYFAKKMAERGIKLGLQGVESVTPPLSDSDTKIESDTSLKKQKKKSDKKERKKEKLKAAESKVSKKKSEKSKKKKSKKE